MACDSATVSFPSVILSAFSLSSFSVRKVVGLVAELDGYMPLAIRPSVSDSASLTIVDVSLAERGAAGDLPGLLLAGSEVLGVHMHDAVGVDVERDLDLRNPARCGRQI